MIINYFDRSLTVHSSNSPWHFVSSLIVYDVQHLDSIHFFRRQNGQQFKVLIFNSVSLGSNPILASDM